MTDCVNYKRNIIISQAKYIATGSKEKAYGPLNIKRFVMTCQFKTGV
jgi:hypothetical protein